MNPTDFSQLPLRDIHLPAAIGWWPPAPGWWLVLAALVVAGGIAAWRYRARFMERAAINALVRVRRALENGDAPVTCVQRISMVVRRFAMSLGGGFPVAGLTGDQWLRFLDSGWDRKAFAEGPGRLIIYGPYAPPDRIDRDDVQTLNELCIEWVRNQRRQR